MNMKLKRAMQFCTLGAATLATANSFAGNEALLKILLENGSINQEQYDALVKAEEAEPSVKMDGGKLEFSQGGDTKFKFQVGGRVHADAAWFSDDSDGSNTGRGELGDGTEIRRARLAVAGTVFNDWHFKGQYDFANDETQVKDAWLMYSGLEHVLGFPLEVMVGNHKEPFSLEEMQSSNDYTYMERSLAYTFSPSRHIGMTLTSRGDVLDGGWTASGGWFGSVIEDDHSDGTDEGYAYVGRVTFAPIATKTTVAHIGGGIEYRKHKGEDLTIRSRPEAHLADDRLVEVDLMNVEDSIKYNAEVAAMYGPFSFIGEYYYADYDAESASSDESPEYEGAYGSFSWVLTGESRKYDVKRGVFKGIKPKNIVGKGGWGAFELAARWSYLDLNDGSLTGGRETNWTFAANWYMTPGIRLMANYIIADTEGGADVPIDPDVMMVRAQVAF